jgi:hypothetical protein
MIKRPKTAPDCPLGKNFCAADRFYAVFAPVPVRPETVNPNEKDDTHEKVFRIRSDSGMLIRWSSSENPTGPASARLRSDEGYHVLGALGLQVGVGIMIESTPTGPDNSLHGAPTPVPDRC